MILTIVGANFEGANIGQNKNVTITLNKTGANGSKSSVTLKKGESVSSNTVIATGLSEASGYENLVVTVTMAGTGDVSHWFSNANGTVTIPSETPITGNITIKAIASKIATGGGDVVDPDPEQPGTGGENGIYPIGQVLDSGTVSTNTTALLPSCTTKDILECGGIYEITITPSYSGNCSLYLGGRTGTQYCLKQQTGVVANTPFTLTFNVPYLNYLDKEKVELNKVWFRSHQSTECTFTYSIKKTGYNNNPLEGVAIFKDSTISATGQRVYGFEAGCTYDYEITPSYTGTMTIYQAYSNAGVSTGSVENIGAMSIASVTANTPIKGTITILETPSVTEATLGRLPDTLILRSHQSVEVSIQYKFTKK